MIANNLTDSPREFQTGGLTIRDFGTLDMEPQDMIALLGPEGEACDVTRMSWGYYLGGSCNARMKDNGYRIAIVRNPQGRIYINAVSESHMDDFHAYLDDQNSSLICWLDSWSPATD